MAQQLAMGTLLGGKYRIGEPLGEGGMGAVYDAVHEDLHRRVAIKVLHPHIAQDATLLERFRREAIAAAELGHPNIIAVSDLQIDPEGLSFMVMERLEGRSLDQVILEEPLSSDRTASIACQLLSALDAAHGAGIIHRDLKPENVFLTTIASVGDLAKLLDFGIAKLVDIDDEGRLTGTGTILGTPIFMSPEQALGEKVTAATDIYSLGGIMFNTVTGTPPRSGATFGAIFNSILTEPVRPVLSLRPDLDPDFAAIVDRALARDAGARFASAREMADALTPHLPGGHTAPGFKAVGDPQQAVSEHELPPSKLSTGAPSASARTAALPSTSAGSSPPSTGDSAPASSARSSFPPWAWIAIGAGAIGVVAVAIIIAVSLSGRGDEAPDAPLSQAEVAPTPTTTDAGDSTMIAGDAQPAVTVDADATAEGEALSQGPPDASASSTPGRAGRARRRRRQRLAARARARKRSSSAESRTASTASEAASSSATAPVKLMLTTVNCRSGFAPRSVSPIRSSVGRHLGAVRRCASSASLSRDAELFRCYNLTLDATGKTTSARPAGSGSAPRFDPCVSGVLRRISFPAKIVNEPIANLQLCFRARSG